MPKNKFLNNEEKEHLTKYFYNNPLKFKIYNYRNNINYSNYNLSVDTENDFKIVKKIFQGRQNEVIELKELIRIYKNITKYRGRANHFFEINELLLVLIILKIV